MAHHRFDSQQPIHEKKTETINYRVNTEPLPGIKIDFTGNRTYSESYQHYFRANEYGQFETFTPTNGGNFTMSYLMLKTSFTSEYNDKSEGSPLFDKLLNNRKSLPNVSPMAMTNGCIKSIIICTIVWQETTSRKAIIQVQWRS